MIKASLLVGMSGLLGSVALHHVPTMTVPAVADDHADPRDIVAKAKVSLSVAVENALAACPGTAVEAELEGEFEQGKIEVFFEVMVVSKSGHLFEVKLDAASGAVTSQEDVSEGDEAGELKSFQNVLRHTELSLCQLLAKASAVVHGYPVKAALEFEDGQPLCEVSIVNGRLIIDADLEARAGHVLELELTSMHQSHGTGNDRDSENEEEEEEEADEEEGGEEREQPHKGSKRGEI